MKAVSDQPPALVPAFRGEVTLRSGGHVDVTGPCSRRVLGCMRILADHVGRRREGLEQPSPAIRLNREGL